MARTQRVRSMCAVDLSREAVALCQALHEPPNLELRRAGAECLPFADASVDVVVNVESCHHYPSPDRFFCETARVLRPGGWLRTASCWTRSGHARFLAAMDRAPLDLGTVEVLTPSVVAALHATNPLEVRLVRRHVSWWLLHLVRHFTAVEGSRVHQEFLDGRIGDLSAALRKGRSM